MRRLIASPLGAGVAAAAVVGCVALVAGAVSASREPNATEEAQARAYAATIERCGRPSSPADYEPFYRCIAAVMTGVRQ